MAKYRYDKKALKEIGVGGIFKFLGEVKERNSKIEDAADDMPKSWYQPNELGRRLHPKMQFAKVSKIEDHGDAKSFTLIPDVEKGTKELAYFRAGHYVSIALEIDGATVCKPYTLCSGPKSSLGTENNSYTLTIKHTSNGFASEYILSNWEVGTEVLLSGPLGNFYYTALRDAVHVVAIAGGSGITPFCSMAAAIADGIEDFNLTILYGSRTAKTILLKDELKKIASRSNGKVKIVHFLSDEEVDGFEHGFITAESIKKYAPKGDYSVFMCGPKAMYQFMETEIEKLSLPKRRLRIELSGEFGNPAQDPSYPKDAAGKVYNVTVRIRDREEKISCKAEQTLLQAMELAGIHAPSDCRSGECGWCHSLLVSGDVFIPASRDGRRMADEKFGWVHPCSTYPLSDVVLDVPTLE